MSRGPVLTLAAVIVLGLVLWGIDLAVQPSTPAASTAAPAAPASTAAPASVPPAAPAEVVPASVKYVGNVTSDHGPIPVAVTVDGGRTKVYVCDGHQIEAWLQGAVSGGSVDATGRNGNHMTAHVAGGRLTGSVHLAGHPDWTFEAPTSTSSTSGIYRRSGGGRTTGWVVQDGNKQVGLSHDATGAVAPAQPLPLDGPLPAGVSAVGATTDVLGSS